MEKMNNSDKVKMAVDGQIEAETPADPRLQVLLHQELIDFFTYKRCLEYRLAFIISNFDFANYEDVERYYDQYVVPQLKQSADESK